MPEIAHMGRGILQKLPQKRVGYKKITERCKEALKVLREEGPLTQIQIMRLAKIPKGSITRLLWHLRELGCIERIGRQYVLHSDVFVYQGKIDRDLALQHSTNVASGLLSKIHVTREPLRDNPEYWEAALQHLKTAPDYREAYESLVKAEKSQKDAVQEEEMLHRGIKERLLSRRWKLKDKAVAEIVAREIYEDIKRKSNKRKPLFLKDLKVDEGKVKSGAYTLAAKHQFKRLKQFISDEEKSKRNLKARESIMRLSKEYITSWQHFTKFAENLVDLVLNGTPLRGKCELCPKVITHTPPA